MKPRSSLDVAETGLLEYIEEIIGTNKFKEEIEDND
jgi:structural maintenance of chromosome 4